MDTHNSPNGDSHTVSETYELHEAHLQAFRERCVVLCDRTTSVACGYQTGLFVTGRPGSGKTRTIREQLDKIGALYILRNGRMTPMGLFNTLEQHPEHVIVIDDVPSLWKDPTALQILLAALGGEPGHGRQVTLTTRGKDSRDVSFEFRGGVIAISNLQLRRDPLSDAVVSRSVLLQHEPTDDELAAVMRDTASKGLEDLTPEQCRDVVEFIIAESRRNDYRLDLRCMTRGLQDYRQVRDGNASTCWQDLIRTSMKQILVPSPLHPLRKRDQLDLDRMKVRWAIEQFPKDPKRQIQETGFGSSKFYQLKAQLPK